MLSLLVGGARTGKSALAVSMAGSDNRPVTFIATAEPLDDEMAARIALHRQHRPAGWSTLEEPLDVGGALAGVAEGATVVLDCLTLWVSNLMGAGHDDGAVLSAAGNVAAAAAEREGRVVVVTNEVGWGIVPADPVSRRYRDLLGAVNMCFAAQAQEVFLVVVGRALALPPAVGPGRPTAFPGAAGPR